MTRTGRRQVAKDAEGESSGGYGGGGADCGKAGVGAGGIGNSNTGAIKLNNEESGRSKYEHGYDLRPRKPVHNE